MTGLRTTRGPAVGITPSRSARTVARRSGLAGTLLAVLVAAGGAFLGNAPGAGADVASTPTPVIATLATPATTAAIPAPPVATSAPGAASIGISTPGAPSLPEAATTPGTSPTSRATAASTPTATPIPGTTASPTASPTATAIASATTRPRVVNAGVTARARLGANAYAVAPSVDLVLVGAPSLALGPGQAIAVDLQAWAGETEVVGIDAFLDFDPAKVQVDSVDLSGSPLDVTLSRTWDNEAGHVNLSVGRLVGASGMGASGYFRVARITFRAPAGFGATSPAATATVTFAADATANRATTVLSRTQSVLRDAASAAVALAGNAIPVAVTAPASTTIIAGIPSNVAFTVLGADNRPAGGVAYAVEAQGNLTLAGPTSGTTDATGNATIRVTGASAGASGLVVVTATVASLPGGTARQARLVQVSTPVAASVSIASPTLALARGTILVVASTTFGPVPIGSRFEVEWRYRTEEGNAIPVEPVAVVTGTGSVATATWDTTALELAPAGVTRTDVTLEAKARAIDANGNVVGLATATFGPMTIDNQAPALAAVAAAGQPMADDPALRTRIATRTFAVTGVTEAGAAVAVYRRDAIDGPRAVIKATAAVTQVGPTRAGVRPRVIVTPATASFSVDLPAFAESDETAAGFYMEVEATDPAGNVGPVTIATVNDRPVATANPYQGWVTIDTVAPRVTRVATPTFDPGPQATPIPIEIEFSEPVALAPSDYGTRVRLEQEILNLPETVLATLQVDCAPDVRPVGTVSVSPGATGTCAAGVRIARIIPASPLYPGSTYHVTVGDAAASVAGMIPVADLAGNILVATADGGPATNVATFLAPGVVAYPQIGITGIATDAVIHSTAATPQSLRAATANVDTALTWRLCTNAACSGTDGVLAPLGIATPTFTVATTTFDVVQWDTMATDGSGVRTFPDRADAWVVVEGRNMRLSGQAGYTSDFRHVTLRSVAPAITAASINAIPCASGMPGAAVAVASATFNLAQDCDTDATGLQTTLTGAVPDAVGGTVTVTAQVAGGNPVNLVTAKPYGPNGSGADLAWTTLGTDPAGWVTVPNGREVTISVTATDRAVPVPNVATVGATARVDTVPPTVALTYPANASRLSAPTGTLDVPVIGASEPNSTIDLQLRRIDTDPSSTIFEQVLPATSTFSFRYPATGGTALDPGTYRLTARATDDAANPGPVATSTFQVTPPPPAAILELPGANGKVGKPDDADTDTDGVQIVLSGRLPVGTTAGQIPEGLVARLIRNGKDALGDGNRPLIAPVNLTASGTYVFAFPALSFRDDDTAEYAVVTSDDAGNRSAASSAVTLIVDLTAPAFTLATPRDGATIGSLRPELAIVIAPSAAGTYDTNGVTFEVRKAASPTFRLIGGIPVDPAGLAGNAAGAGVVRIASGDWASGDGLDSVESPATENYVLRVTATDDVGNARAASSTFILKPGVPAVTVTQGGAAVLGTVDVTGEDPPEIGVTAGVTGDGVTLAGVTATIRNRAGTVTTPVPLTGTGGTRALDFATASLPNGTIHDLVVTATDSNGRSATSGASIRIIRPRDLAVTVRRGGSVATGTMVLVRRDGGDLPGVTATSGTHDVTTDSAGIATFTGIPGGPVLIAVTGVPGYPVTTVAATITEPHAAATSPWAFTIDLDALNPNTVTTTLRGLPGSVTGSATLGNLVAVDVIAPAGAQFTDTRIGVATSPLVHAFADTIATIDRGVARAAPTVNGTAVTTTTRLPNGAIAWRVIPTLSGSAANDAKVKGASETTAVFASGTTGENVPVSFRYAATNLRVKSLSGTVARPDGSPVSGATVIIAQPGGLSVTATSSLEGTFGPVLVEAGDYIVTAVASPGSDWLPGRAGRISFALPAPGESPVAESGKVDLKVLAAGGTVQARVTRAGTGGASLATGKVVLIGQGQVITATAGAAVLPGQDATTGPNVTVAAPSGNYVLTVVPDDGALTPPDPVTILVIDGKTRTVTADELPPMEKTLGRLTGLVRLTTGEPLDGLTVQARRDGEASVIPATTDDAGIYSVAAPAGSYIVSAVIPRGAALLPGNAMAAVVTPRTTTTVGDLAIAPAAAVIERNLARTGGGALTEDEAAGLSGTAFVKNLATGAGTSITFTGTRIRLSVPVGTYRLGIAITAGGFLAPEAETGIVASASAPNVATRTLTPSNIPVTGQLVTGQSDTAPGTNVALRTVVRATGTSGPAAGVVNLTESTTSGAFAFTLAPGTWRLAASPDASQGYLTNPDRPYIMVTIGADSTVSPVSPGIDLRAASRTVAGTATVSINGTDVPLAGVKVRLEVTGSTGGALALSEVTDRDGLFTFAAPTGTATISASGASARYGTSTGGMTADDPASVIDPAPAGVPEGNAPVAIRFTNASIKVAGTVRTGDGRTIGGVTVSATSSDGLVRTTTTSGGSLPGRYEFRLSPGTWHLMAATEITRADGSRVPAASADTPVTVASLDQTGQTITLIESAVELPPSATAGADPDSGGQVRAGLDSAELLLAPNAVSEPVNVSIDPLGNVPSLPGFYPFGDAFRIGATTASTSQAVSVLAVDSTVKITYSRTTLAKFSATGNQVPASASDLRAALFDASTSSYTAFDGAVAANIDDSTGQFIISTTNLGTFVLTTRNALTRIPAIVTGVTASPSSSGTLRTGATITITLGFSQPVTVVTSGGTPRIAMGTGTSGAARTPATHATYASGSGTTSLTFTYAVSSGDTASDLDYASTTALEANGGTIRNGDGFDATLTLAQPGQSGSISVGSAIVIDTTTPAIVTGVTASPSSGTLRTGASITITIGFSLPVTVVTSGGTPRIAMGTGASGAARTPATHATYASGSGTTSLTFTYVVSSGDTASDLDFASTTALEANGGTIRNADGIDATLTLAQPGLSGSISVVSAIVIDTTTVPDTGGGSGGGGGGGEATTTVPTAKPVVAPVVTIAPTTVPAAPAVSAVPAIPGPPGVATDALARAFGAIPGGLTATAARAIGAALVAVDAGVARAFVATMSALPPGEAATVLGVIGAGTADEGRAAITIVTTLPPGSSIARPGGSLVAADGKETLTFAIDDDTDAPRATTLADGAEVAGARVATTVRGPVVFLVRAGQAALVTRPRSGAWPDLRFPLLSGRLAGTGPAVALPAAATSIAFDPMPAGLNEVERGSLGGGTVIPIAHPFAIGVEATEPDARVLFTLPSPMVAPGQVLAYLHSLRGPGGRFLGYLRAPASFDPTTGSQSWSLEAAALTDLLVLPAAVQPAYVQNFDAATHLHSGPDEFAIDFGEAGPAFTTFTVVGPQVGARIHVYSPVSRGYAWIDVGGVGPSGPPTTE